jgi:hypothetical protein
MRSVSPALGPAHPATQLAAHNLACCLDALGLGAKAAGLLREAHGAFSEQLGRSHPRALAAARNLELLQARCGALAHPPTGAAAARQAGGAEGLLLAIRGRQERRRSDPFRSLQHEEPNGHQQLAAGTLLPTLSAKRAYQAVSAQLELRRSWQQGGAAAGGAGFDHSGGGKAAAPDVGLAAALPEAARAVLRHDATIVAAELPLVPGARRRAALVTPQQVPGARAVEVPLRKANGQRLDAAERKALAAAALERTQEHGTGEALIRSWKAIDRGCS